MPTHRNARRLLAALVVAVAILRFLSIVYAGLHQTHGDFFESFPGPNAKSLNPTLWNDPELTGAAAHIKEKYFYGPSEYLLLFPLNFLPSFNAIAQVLLAAYGLAILGVIWLVTKTLTADERADPVVFAQVLCVTFMFSPLLRAYIQRELEIPLIVMVSAATYLLVTRRELLASGLLAYSAWFKFWPLLFVPYFLVRRRYKAVLVFIAVSAAVLGLSAAVFDLDKFLLFAPANGVLGSVIEPRPTFELLGSPGSEIFGGRGFCRVWGDRQEMAASIHWALCGLSRQLIWFPARDVFYALCAVIGGLFLVACLKLDRGHALSRGDARWRVILEMSLVIVAGTLLVHNEYHWLGILVIPLSALLIRYVWQVRNATRLALLALSYVVLAAFVVPVSVLSRIVEVDVARWYSDKGIYMYGELILIGLLIWEYGELASRRVASELTSAAVPTVGRGRLAMMMRIGVAIAMIVAALAITVSRAEIRGTVVYYHDDKPVALPGATVTILGSSLPEPRRAVSDRAGGFGFPSLKPGRYTVETSGTGFYAGNHELIVTPGSVAVLQVDVVRGDPAR
jgi:glycosyl transferase family 87/carboxypeptidase family protein